MKHKILTVINTSLLISAFFTATIQGLENETSLSKDYNRLERKIHKLGLERSGKAKDCVASWYGGFFHGRTTANMEIYNKDAITAAHKKLPFNTYLLVTNKSNNKTIIVRVNDRGPYIKGREVDLSEGAALALGGRSDGLMNISYEILQPVV